MSGEEPKPNAAADFLSAIRGSPVVVKIASGIEYRGTLQAIDGFMNVTLTDTEETYKGVVIESQGEMFLRGSLVTYIAAQ